MKVKHFQLINYRNKNTSTNRESNSNTQIFISADSNPSLHNLNYLKLELPIVRTTSILRNSVITYMKFCVIKNILLTNGLSWNLVHIYSDDSPLIDCIKQFCQSEKTLFVFIGVTNFTHPRVIYIKLNHSTFSFLRVKWGNLWMG